MVSTDLLRQIRLLRGLNQEEIDTIAEMAGVWECPKGQYIFKEGDESDVLYILQNGEMAIVISTGLLVNHTIETLTEGAIFGELGFVDRKQRSASVRCTKRSTLITITREDFRRVGQDHPNIQRIIYKNLAKIIAERLRSANDRLKDLAGKDKAMAEFLPNQFIV